MERINRQKHLSLMQRSAIIGQHIAGLSNGQISRSLNRATASKWVNRYVTEHSLERRPQPGQVRKLDELDLNDVAERGLDTPFINAAEVGRQYGVHRDTIRKVWNDIGLFNFVPAKKPKLTQDQRDERLGYALQNLTRYWPNVIFSDEKVFQSDSQQRLHLYRPRNCRYDERYIQPIQRSGRISAGLWGWISIDGPGEMTMINGRLNSTGYTEILEDNLLRTIDISYGGLGNIVFMQDNNSFHTSKLTRRWFSRHPELELINAPVNSPDLNPIENLWAKMVHDWKNVFPRNRARLGDYIVERWEAERNNPHYFQNLYASMPYRMQEVIDKNCGMTKY
ncbi:Transposable element Tcb2 transposase [Pseudolycoriella hygida]|uniref:Transposable element Tcb2 transposase n=1 Tax=Pseudolycoriella hygida TaxID=35572 RepID=A0A9Q0N380_9DIPT|nr:Transposable element Tcb2 transposase [Pseudolycoriella hygida]